jgi:crossover junction endodeoxyribonuclease RusA
MKVLIELPYPPSANTMWRRGRFSTYLSDVGRKFKEDVADYLVTEQVPKFGDAALKISMILRPRDKRKADIDNRIKSVLDALEGAGLFNNDYQVEDLHIVRGEPIKGGKMIVIVEAVE